MEIQPRHQKSHSPLLNQGLHMAMTPKNRKKYENFNNQLSAIQIVPPPYQLIGLYRPLEWALGLYLSATSSRCGSGKFAKDNETRDYAEKNKVP